VSTVDTLTRQRYIDHIRNGAGLRGLKMETNYASFVKRIEKAITLDDVLRLNLSLDRLYNSGQITVSEFKRLDAKIVDKHESLSA